MSGEPKRKKGARGAPYREGKPAIHRINLHLTGEQMKAIEAAHPGRKPAEVVLLALAAFVPSFQTEVKP